MVRTDVLILESMRRQMAYVKTLWFLKRRGAWRFFVRPFRMNNKSIAQRYQA